MWSLVEYSLKKQGFIAHNDNFDSKKIFDYKDRLLETLSETLLMSSKSIENVKKNETSFLSAFRSRREASCARGIYLSMDTCLRTPVHAPGASIHPLVCREFNAYASTETKILTEHRNSKNLFGKK